MANSRGNTGIMVQPVDWTGYQPFKSAVATDGTYMYVICTEGVGRRIDEDEVARMTAEGEPIDLADWIRTFGSRLEVNFQLWADKLRDEQWEERCPVCDEFADYCQGHGEIGDPAGYAILTAHDSGDHSNCHADARCRQHEHHGDADNCDACRDLW